MRNKLITYSDKALRRESPPLLVHGGQYYIHFININSTCSYSLYPVLDLFISNSNFTVVSWIHERLDFDFLRLILYETRATYTNVSPFLILIIN